MIGADALERIAADIAVLATMSASGAGTTRLAYTDEDAAARQWFERKCNQIGLRFEMDWVGNCFGWSPEAGNRPPLLLGSHLDSVIEGGRYDGVLGVVVGFEVLRHLLAEAPGLPLGVVAFACEESTQFGIGTVGSRYLMGELDEDDAETMRARSGETLAELLAGGRLGTHRVAVQDDLVHTYLEVHVDQGSVLTSAGIKVGLVDTIAAIERHVFEWIGEASHSGAHSRTRRKDALLAAAEFALATEAEWAEREADGRTLSVTVGQLDVRPNSPNTVPGHVDLVLDVRSADLETLRSVEARLQQKARAIADARGVGLVVTRLGMLDSIRMSTGLLPALKQVADRLDIPTAPVLSLAGHDAMVVGKRFPAAMVFVANPAEVSHSPDESVDQVGLHQALELLVAAVPELLRASPRD